MSKWMIVDDDDSEWRKTMSEMYQQLGMEVQQANFEEAQSAIDSGNPPELVLLDIRLNEDVGSSALSAFLKERQRYQKKPVHDVFISYARSDWGRYVEPLVSQLKEAELSIWLDQLLIRGGDDWLDKINDALEECKYLILCVTPSSIRSQYVRMEYRYFLEEKKPVLPILFEETKLPAELRRIQYLLPSEIEKISQLIGAGLQ